eukprot:6189792-Pleurochrysis_carterae.AAC.2
MTKGPAYEARWRIRLQCTHELETECNTLKSAARPRAALDTCITYDRHRRAWLYPHEWRGPILPISLSGRSRAGAPSPRLENFPSTAADGTNCQSRWPRCAGIRSRAF